MRIYLFPNSFLNLVCVMAMCFTVVMCVYIYVTKGGKRRSGHDRRNQGDSCDCRYRVHHNGDYLD